MGVHRPSRHACEPRSACFCTTHAQTKPINNSRLWPLDSWRGPLLLESRPGVKERGCQNDGAPADPGQVTHGLEPGQLLTRDRHICVCVALSTRAQLTGGARLPQISVAHGKHKHVSRLYLRSDRQTWPTHRLMPLPRHLFKPFLAYTTEICQPSEPSIGLPNFATMLRHPGTRSCKWSGRWKGKCGWPCPLVLSIHTSTSTNASGTQTRTEVVQ